MNKGYVDVRTKKQHTISTSSKEVYPDRMQRQAPSHTDYSYDIECIGCGEIKRYQKLPEDPTGKVIKCRACGKDMQLELLVY